MEQQEIDRLYEENVNLVWFVINKFVKNKDELNILCSKEDLFQVGSIALCHAITSYNKNCGAFSTYATNVIKNKIYNELRDSSDRTLDSALSVDDENSGFGVENDMSLSYNNSQEVFAEVEEKTFEEAQKKLLFSIADRYTGVSKKGVLAIQLMTQGYTCKAIAKVFNTDDKTLTAWVARARSKLRKEPEILKLLGKE